MENLPNELLLLLPLTWRDYLVLSDVCRRFRNLFLPEISKGQWKDYNLKGKTHDEICKLFMESQNDFILYQLSRFYHKDVFRLERTYREKVIDLCICLRDPSILDFDTERDDFYIITGEIYRRSFKYPFFKPKSNRFLERLFDGWLNGITLNSYHGLTREEFSSKEELLKFAIGFRLRDLICESYSCKISYEYQDILTRMFWQNQERFTIFQTYGLINSTTHMELFMKTFADSEILKSGVKENEVNWERLIVPAWNISPTAFEFVKMRLKGEVYVPYGVPDKLISDLSEGPFYLIRFDHGQH